MKDSLRLTDILLSAILLVVLAILVMVGSVAYRASATVNRILNDVDRVVERLEALEQKLDRTVPVDELDSILNEVALLQEDAEQDSLKFKPDAEAEVKFLLRRLRSVADEYRYSDESRSPLRFYAHLYAKYRVYRGSLTSAEDFIDRVATKTVTGKTYFAVLEDGSTKELAKLLREELQRYREEGGTVAGADPVE